MIVKKQDQRFRSGAAAVLGAMFFLSPAPRAQAQQFDAPFLSLEANNRQRWEREDQRVDRKLAALERRFEKKPNIIYILADDVGWGELGSYLGGKLMGRPSETLDQMAAGGMKFLSHYAEPSCTPTRLAILTGRHPVRTGVNTVLWPGGPEHVGLHPEELTVAEVLSDAGYHTAMWGKWHVGDAEMHAPENQGFDFAHYGLFNGAVWFWLDVEGHYKDREIVTGAHPFHDFPGVDEYAERFGIDIAGGYYVGRKGRGRERERALTSSKDMEDFEETSIDEITGFIRDKAKSDRPFFIYWATYFHQDASSPQKYRLQDGVDYVNNQAAQAGQHDEHMRRLLQTLRDEGIEENTLVVWVSDNGPMDYFWPNGGYTWLRGHKGDVLEGGVRTPGIAYWPGMIEARQDPIDMIHVVDLFTTAARLAGVKDRLPTDRITDGIDQTALLVMGEGHGRRDYIFHYSGSQLGAVRMRNLKLLFKGPEKGGIPQADLFNIMRDPREEHAHESTGSMLAHNIPFQYLIRSHLEMKRQFPDRVLAPPASSGR